MSSADDDDGDVSLSEKCSYGDGDGVVAERLAGQMEIPAEY